MFRSYRLHPTTSHNVALEFEWDAESGQLRGPGAEIVGNMCKSAVRDGSVQGHPYPTAFDIHDPLRSLSEMAVVLGQFWNLDSDLAAAYPAIADEKTGDDTHHFEVLN